jgi:putative tricarboxylic transport membrane protein
MIHNLNPGPKLFTEQPALVYGLFASMFIANVFMLLVGTFGAKLWVRVGYIKKTILYPLIFAFAILGSYAIKKSMFDVGTCLVFGLIGWMFKKFDYPSSPLVLGLVLGKLIETNYVQTLMVTGPVGFVQRPLTVILFLISIAALAYPIIIAKVHARKEAKKNE